MLTNSKILGLLSVFSFYTCRMDTPIDPAKVLETIQLEDGFQVELVAMEPLLSDPVDMVIDEFGQVYVVEMHGYPLDIGGSGVIRHLLDTDQDGKFDKSTIYYDGLTLPTGIMRWKNGFLITDPPDVLYLEDTDSDGIADHKEVILTGFALSNPQHNVNNPEYGLDNWIYLANEGTYTSKDYGHLFGDTGQEIRFPDQNDAPVLPPNGLGRNVRFNPDKSALEMLSGRSQYGHTFDPWGRHFTTNNASHLYHEVIGAQYLARNPNLPLRHALQYVPDYGRGFNIFPVTQNPEHQLLTDVGVITSSCGVTWYTGGLFPAEYQQVTFIAEPTHNLVHTDVVYDKGATFGSRRHLENSQFLASTDAWFRPVNFYIGPDGSLYVLDYYRKIIEHPEWMAEEVIQSGSLYAGSDQGRLFRISPKGSPAPLDLQRQPGNMPDAELVPLLAHKNLWWRKNAQRLLVDHQNKSIIPALKDFTRNTPSGFGRVHGIWTLDGLGAFDQDLVESLFGDAEAGVREHAIKLAEKHRDAFPGLEEQLLQMISDPDPKVRFQVLCSLGFFSSEKAREARQSILFHDFQDNWVQTAVLSSESIDEIALLKQAAQVNVKDSASANAFFQLLGSTVSRSAQPERIVRFLTSVLEDEGKDNGWRSGAMSGLTQHIGRVQNFVLPPSANRKLKASFAKNTEAGWRTVCLELLHELKYFESPEPSFITKAVSVLAEKTFDTNYRLDALKVLAWNAPKQYEENFYQLLENQENEKLQRQAIWAIGKSSNANFSDYFLDQWKHLTPSLKESVIQQFMSNDRRKISLLKAVKDGKIQPPSIPWRQTVSLLNSRNDEVRELARQLLQGNDLSLDSVWVNYQVALTLTGNANKGSEIFTLACSICHQISADHGIAFGPDLAPIRNRNKASILLDILKPNKSIADGFQLWTIQTYSNQIISGMISNESINSITVRDASGQESTFLRNDITTMEASEISAMPEGLHQQINQQQMADILAFLKEGDRGFRR